MSTFSNDLKYALRMLVKQPGLALTVICILALGIGPNTALFSVIQSVLLSPLPFQDPGRLLLIRTQSDATGRNQACSGPDYLDWAEQNKVFESICAFTTPEFTMTNAGEPVIVNGLGVTHNFTHTLGASIPLGQSFLPQHMNPGEREVVILSHQLWRDRFSADPNILGRTITLDGSPRRVVGVAQPTLGFIEEFTQLFVPMRTEFFRLDRGHRYLSVIARLKRGVTLAQAQADLDVISNRLSHEYVESNKHQRAVLHPLHEIVLGTVGTAFLILYGAVGLLLVIACMNVSMLLLARSGTRKQELAIRCALGAGRTRLIRQMLTESMLLALLGGVGGLVLGVGGLHGLRLIAPTAAQTTGGQVPGFEEIALNLPVLGFTLAVSILTGLLFGWLPAWKGARLGMSETIKQAGHLISRSSRHHRTQDMLVMSQITLAVLLLVGAGLLIRSYGQLQRTHLGFEPRHLLTVHLKRLNTSSNQPPKPFFADLIQHLKRIPGIESATATTAPPLTFNNRYGYPKIINQPTEPGEELASGCRIVASDYFRCVRIPVLKGRSFQSTDDQHSPPVVIVNQAFVDQFLGRKEPLGQLVDFAHAAREIVGVVGDVKTNGLQPRSFVPLIYRPLQQVGPRQQMTLLIRTAGDPHQWIPLVRQAIWDMDAAQPIQRIQTMGDVAADSVSVERFSMILLMIMAGVALLIAVVGLYGVVSYTVNERQTEIGIRLALGAEARDILSLVLKRALFLSALGLGLGLAGAVAVGRLMSSLLYDTGHQDPATLLLVAFLLFSAVMLACLLPARKAMKLDPMDVLRYE